LDRPRTVKLVLEYDGARYAGWQFQTNAVSVQETLEKAVAAVVGERVRLHGAGRTDAGVHALGAVAHFHTDSPIPPEELKRALNALLPEDVAVRAVEDAPEGFHARYSARGKIYLYAVRNHRDRTALDRGFHWQVAFPLDLDAMREGARSLQGTHDFRGFASVPPGTDATRTLKRIEIGTAHPHVFFLLEADGFLWKMVRRIVGSLVEVGRGKRPPSWIGDILKSKGALAGGPTAPPAGLVLLRVLYGGDEAGPAESPPWPGGFFLAGQFTRM